MPLISALKEAASDLHVFVGNLVYIRSYKLARTTW